MKTTPEQPKGFPKTLTEGSARVSLYWQANPRKKLDKATGKLVKTGEFSDLYTLAYYEPTQITNPETGEVKAVQKRVLQKFADLGKAEREAGRILNRLANLDGEALKLTGADRLAYVDAVRILREWNPDARLALVANDYVAAMKLLPRGSTLQQAVADYAKRHPINIPPKSVKFVVDELIATKTNKGRSDVYIKDLTSRLDAFADDFKEPIATITAGQINEWVSKLEVSGRTQRNYLRVIGTLLRFAKRRGYLSKDYDEISNVEQPRDEHSEIEVFTPAELRKLFKACLTPVKERGVMRTREEMIPYLAIAAFCGLRSAEVARLDWREVHLVGNEHFIEVKASKAKTASRRTVPIPENCARWLAPLAKASGPVCDFERPDKQCYQYIGPAAEVEWKHNALRHSFISYRLAETKNVNQVALEAGNSPAMIFKHYRQLVRDSEATEWFGIVPPNDWKNIVPMATEETLPIPAANSPVEARASAATC
jgi:integrase